MLLTQTIPVVDLADFASSDPDRQQAFVTVLGKALQEIGFFAVVNHGVDPALIASAYQVTQAVFELPNEVKSRYEDPALKGQRGFTSFGREHAKGQTAPDLKEFWHVGAEGIRPDNIWPLEVPPFSSVIQRLYGQLNDCASHLLQATALYLGESREFLSQMAIGSPTLLRIIHYPPIPPDALPQSVRAAAHEDINLITLLCEATAPGLELQQRDGSWLPILPLSGQIIVDAGDMLQQLTNGLLKSTTHRVTNPDNDRERRFSIPFFVHPRPEIDLTPLPGCIARTGGQAKFPSITAGEYLEQRLREIGLA